MRSLTRLSCLIINEHKYLKSTRIVLWTWLLAMININHIKQTASPPPPLQKREKSLTPNPSPKEMGVIRLEGVEKVKG